MKFHCKCCRELLEIDEHYLGEKVICPVCERETFVAAITSDDSPLLKKRIAWIKRHKKGILQLLGILAIILLCFYFPILIVVGLVGAGLWYWGTYHSHERTQGNYVCRSCGTRTDGRSKNSGSILILILLLCFLIIPGIIYLVWMAGADYKACDACGSKDIIPADSPMGRNILR